MTGPPTSLPPQIAELMTVLTVGYQKYTGFDEFSQSTYATSIDLTAWVEPYGISGGAEAFRKADGTIIAPTYELYFDGDSEVVQGFSLFDRFTLNDTPAASSLGLEPLRIGTYLGPNFDNENPWLVSVVLGQTIAT
jgi:hypothetical protein